MNYYEAFRKKSYDLEVSLLWPKSIFPIDHNAKLTWEGSIKKIFYPNSVGG